MQAEVILFNKIRDGKMMKKYLFIFVLLTVLAGCGKVNRDGRPRNKVDYASWYNDDENTDDGKPGVMIMSFNVRYSNSTEDTGDKNWSRRRAGCYKMINSLRPVLMGVQECRLDQRNDLKGNCPGYEVIGRSRDNTADGEQVAIFYLSDSVVINDWKTFWLSDTPDVVSKYPAAGSYRCATMAKVTHIKSGSQFCYINTHLDLDGVREFEMSVILDQMGKYAGSLPVVMTGDWNDAEDSNIFTEMYETFHNARWSSRSGDAYGTYNGFSNPNTTTKLDHIFYRGFSVCAKFITVKQAWEGFQFISDHYPVYAILKF